jgi:hypothetical protein
MRYHPTLPIISGRIEKKVARKNSIPNEFDVASGPDSLDEEELVEYDRVLAANEIRVPMRCRSEGAVI